MAVPMAGLVLTFCKADFEQCQVAQGTSPCVPVVESSRGSGEPAHSGWRVYSPGSGNTLPMPLPALPSSEGDSAQGEVWARNTEALTNRPRSCSVAPGGRGPSLTVE